MCGIAGLYNIDLPLERKQNVIHAMTGALQHRGPDGGNVFISDGVALGHRRLSIIAPSENANQPMRRGSLVIVYNGELYNYREEKERLSERGVSFFTESDTEVILALYEAEGTDCFKRLNGIFAFAIYDERTGSLVCVRDHFGVKPFLYTQQGRGILFASELKSLLASRLVDRKIDQRSLFLLLQNGSVPQPDTMVEGIKSLMPGHYMICSSGGITITRYYTLTPEDLSLTSDAEWKDAIHEALRKAVRGQLVADVPVGAFLSGGVDSGLIAAMMREWSSQVKTYSVGFENAHASGPHDETDEAAAVAACLGTQHTTLTVCDATAAAILPDIIRDLDHPSIDGVNSYFVSKATSDHARVALSGTGADEIFGGYIWFEQMRSYENSGALHKIKHALTGMSIQNYYSTLHGVFPRSMAKSLMAAAPSVWPNLEFHAHMPTARGARRTSDLVIGTFLQNQLLPDIDTASMAHGLEVRVPYLSVPLVERAMALPDHLKLGHKNANAPVGSYAAEGTKKILVDIAREYLPAGFDMRPKRGFAMPMQRWMDTIWKDQMQEAISYETIKTRGLFNPQKISNIAAKGAMPWTWSWLLMAVELWCRHVLDEHEAA